MFFMFTPYALILFLITLLAIILFGITLKKKDEPGGTALLGVLVSLMVWSFFAGLSAGFGSISYKIIATKLAYFGIVSLPVNLLLFSLYYTNNHKFLSPFKIFLLWLIPLIGQLLILTNERHNLIWTGYSYRTSILGSALVFDRGVGFWGLIIFFYSCVVFTFFMIFWTAFRYRYIYRKNMTVLMILLPVSLLVNILYVFDLIPGLKGFDPTPFSLIIFSSLLVWSFTRHKFFDLSPVGREVVIDQMRALLMILDDQNRIVDFNNPMLAIIQSISGKKEGFQRKAFIGHPIKSVFTDWPEFLERFFGEEPDQNEVELCLENQRYVFEIQKKALENRDARSQGWLVFLFDITDRVQIVEAEIRNRQIAQSLHEIAMVLNSSLDPQNTLNLALEQIGKIIKYDIANISILVGEERVVEFQRGYQDPKAIVGSRIPMENSPHQLALIHRHPVMYANVREEFPLFINQLKYAVNSLLCIPMYAKDQVLGFLTLGSEKKNYFTNDDLSIADTYASQVAIALQNSRLYSQVNRRLTEQSIMNEIIRIGTSRMEKKDFARAITAQIQRFIETPGVLVLDNNPDEETWYFVDSSDVVKYQVDHMYSYQDGLSGYLLKNGKPLLLNSAEEVESFLNNNHRQMIGPVPKTFMGAPMITKDRVIGAIVAHDLERERAFDEEDFQLFLMITSQAAIGFENVRLINQLEYLAKTDALTGIYNRGHFNNVSKKIVNGVEKNKSQVSMIMMDVDHFKGINDAHGHQLGDLVLQQIVEACKKLLRDKDVIGRVGGEEFSIVLPDTNLEEAEKIAERIRQAIEEMKIQNHVSIVQTTVSLGVASSQQLEMGTFEDLIQVSDEALYQAKADGRNCVRIYKHST
jgi:diguanylate cyclase (GGDEF)-like protein